MADVPTADNVIVALIAATPPTVMALAGLLKSRRVHKEVRTVNGGTLATMVEDTQTNVTQTQEDVASIKEQLEETYVAVAFHLADKKRHLDRRDEVRREEDR